MPKVAVLIDGGFFLKRYPAVKPSANPNDAAAAALNLQRLVHGHLLRLNKTYGAKTPKSLLYRAFYYDSHPYEKKAHKPVSGRALDYDKTDEAIFRRALFDELKRRPGFALRLGYISKERSWVISEKAQKALLNKSRTVDDLTDEDFSPGLRQKGVDMRIGLDIATITLKKQADIIVLVTGDNDFVPAAKLARKEGVQIILDPMWRNFSNDLSEHIDATYSGLRRENKRGKAGK